jgi:hypothetical protein
MLTLPLNLEGVQQYGDKLVVGLCRNPTDLYIIRKLRLCQFKVLVGAPQWSKFGGSGAKFCGSWECDIAKFATS